MNEAVKNKAIIRAMEIHNGSVYEMAVKLVKQEEIIDICLLCPKCRKLYKDSK